MTSTLQRPNVNVSDSNWIVGFNLPTSNVYFSERCLAEYSESISAKRRRLETLEMFLEKIENRTINQREIEMLEQMIDFKSNNNSVS